MLALLLDHGLSLEERPEPVPAPGEALLRVRLAGICNTDLELLRGYKGFRGIPGHEFVGVVEACEEASWIGRRVVGEINCGCGACPGCLMGDPRHCPGRRSLGISGLDGAFAEFLALPVANLHPVPDGVPDEAAVFTEPLAAAVEVLEQLHLAPSDRVAVLGDGKLGLLVAQVLAWSGCDLVAVGRHPQKLALLQSLGIRTLLQQDGLPENLDVVVEATGSARGVEQALQAVRPRGRVVLKSTVAGAVSLDLSSVVVRELTLIGSRCGPFPPALRALAAGRVRVEPLIQSTFPLSQAVEAFSEAGRRGALKVLIRPR